MEYLILSIASIVCLGSILMIRKRFLNKTYPQKTQQLFNDLSELEKLGFVFKGDKYEGVYKNFLTYIFVTTNMKGSDQVIVMVATDSNSGPIDFLNTFFSGYFKNDTNTGCTYVNFRLFMRLMFDPSEGVQNKLDKLIERLNEKGIKPYQLAPSN